MTDQTGSLAAALSNAQSLLAVTPALAEEQAREILKIVPGNPHAAFLLAQALRAQNNNEGAFETLQKLVTTQSRSAAVQFEFGSVMIALGKHKGAVLALSRAAELEPNNPAIWRALGNVHTLLGDARAADLAYARNIKASVNDPKLIEAASALVDNRLAVAERLLREFLKAHPTDVSAIRMLAETGARLGVYDDSEKLLARALELAPGFDAARHNYAVVLHRQMKSEAALAQINLLLEEEPKNPSYLTLRAAILARIGDYPDAIRSYEALLRANPAQPKAWMSYGHTLKTVGRQDDSVAAYRKSIALLPNLGESYWSMANLKTFAFTPDDVVAMEAQLKRSDISEEDRFHLHFALGKAHEDDGDYKLSFEHYAEGNALRRKTITYDADLTTENMHRAKAVFTPGFVQQRTSSGSQTRDPIFVVGLPRSGSTLIEQILSSHSQVEGTMELPDIAMIIREQETRKRRSERTDYPDNLGTMEPERFAALGEEYLRRAAVQRKFGKLHFIDKMPNNFLHIGFIHLTLPNAKIVDARRHPLGCCSSNFKQHFAQGQGFTYDLTDMGRYYRDYVELMAHFDAALPGRVHRVLYENMIDDPEREIRALLDYCGLPFEDSCLRYYENDRAVRTASAQQVRQPIYTEGLNQWRHYEEWLGPLKAALGPVLDAYPDVPAF